MGARGRQPAKARSGPRAPARPDRVASSRYGDPVRAATVCRTRDLPPHPSRSCRRPGPRWLAGPRTRPRHVRRQRQNRSADHRHPRSDVPEEHPGTWTSRILSHATIHAGTVVGNRLGVTPNTAVLRIARQRLVNGEPICLETIHVLSEIVPGFDVQAIEHNSFYALLQEAPWRDPDRRRADPCGSGSRCHRVRPARPCAGRSDPDRGANHP